MASTQFAGMGSRPANLKTEQFDMDSFFDFNQSSTQPSPATASSSKIDATPKTANEDWSAISPFDQEARQRFNGPSHDYNLYRQQVGLPTGSMANMPQQSMFDGYGPGIGDMGLDSGMTGWSSGIDMDSEMNMDFNNPQSAMPAMFFPSPNNDNHADNFVNPNTLGGQEDTTSSVGRLWPGMHSQQAQHAAMQKAAQAHAVQQRQMKLQAQHAQYRQAAASNSNSQSQGSSQNSQGHSKRPSHASEPHVEESISRLLNQMRQNSAVSANDDDDDDQGNMLPHIARMKKDEEEMDEDERLLASEEGKKLSSKERRQLRNKVSARAFRSRRKGSYCQHSKMTTRSMLTKGAEYIGQLEGEVALKAQEANTLRNENSALMQENERYRGLIETLLRHPAFTPFINDISKDPSVLGVPQQHQSQHQEQQHQPSMTPTPQHPQPQQQQQQAPQQDSKPDFMNFDASQLQIPQQQHQQQQQSEQVGLAMIPENDFSKLNINGFNSMNFNNFHSVNAFAVTDVPKGPDPVNLLVKAPLRLPRSCSASSSAPNPAAACDSDMTVLLAKLDGAARNVNGSSCPA